jgi:major membrane immunogen (membrane-anchored lipoprotein)
MALDPTELATDIKNDSSITDNIPATAIAGFENFADRLAIHITTQIKRGSIDDVKVSSGATQSNVTFVK